MSFVTYCLRDATSCVILSMQSKVARQDSVADLACTLKTCVIILESLPQYFTVQEELLSGIKIFSFKEFLDLGNDNLAEAASLKTEDICTIMYTSGTTGDPKVGCPKLLCSLWTELMH